MKTDLQRLAPDLFIRHFLAAELLKQILDTDKPLKILDVGGRESSFFKYLPEGWEVSILDIRDNDFNEPNYIKGDASQMDFADKLFDFVVSFDTLEHIPEEKKKKSVLEMIRVSKNGVLIAAPFFSEEAVNAELYLNKIYKDNTGTPHLFLQEHLESGLPKEVFLEKIFKDNKLKFRKLTSNNINNWMLFIGITLLEFIFGIDKELQDYYEFYNKNFTALDDNLDPTYRKIYIAVNNEDNFKIISNYKIEYKRNNILYQEFVSKSLDLLARKIKLSETRLQELIKTAADEKNNLLIEKEQLVKHTRNLEETIENIQNAKFFKVWGFYSRTKTFVKMFLNPSNYKKGVKLIIYQGPKPVFYKLINYKFLNLKKLNFRYRDWVNKTKLSENDLEKLTVKQKNFSYRPKISIITPVYNTEEKYLRAAIESVINQRYDNWELCLVDDYSTNGITKKIIEEYQHNENRIKSFFLSSNIGISLASNKAIGLADGEFLALMDHDDEIAPNALFEVVQELNKNKDLDMIYSDEDKISEEGEYCDPYFKPDWSPDTFLSSMYTPHLIVLRKDLVDKIGGFREGFEGSQDYDLILRLSEKTNRIHHIPKILYHWRKIEGSTAAVYSAKNYAHQASIKALNESLVRRKENAVLEEGLWLGSFRVRYKIQKEKKVSIIIPTKDKIELVEELVSSIIEKTTYKNYEILIVDNNSKDKKTWDYYGEIKAKSNQVNIIEYNKPFNFSAINNFGASKAKGEYLLFLNNDTKVINSEWLSSMVEHIQRKEIGAVGPKLLFGDDTIQHIGVITGVCGEIAGHPFYGLSNESNGYFGNINMVRNVRAVTGACLMTKRSVFNEIGGFDTRFVVSYNDVDICLRIIEKGYRIIYTPYSNLYHFESKSLGKVSEGNRKIDYNEVLLMKKVWGKKLSPDPYYNPNLSKSEPYLGFNV